MMINVVDKYFSLNRTLLLTVGLWPYQKSKLARLQTICIFSIIISGIIFQLTAFVTSKCTADRAIKILSVSCAYISLAIKYNAFWVNAETVKYLIDEIQRIYDDIKVNEIVIIERYVNIARRNTIALTTLVVIGLLFIVINQLWPNFFYIILSVNRSQSHSLLFVTEYFVDEEKYFYLLLLHTDAALCIGAFALIATGTMIIVYLQYACGMFKIASYRIEHAMKIYITDINSRKKNKIHENIICAVDIHRKAMMFSTHFITKFEMSFMFLIIFGVITLSLNIFQVISIKHNMEQIILHFGIASLCLLYMFLSNFHGQEIMDHNNHIFVTAYNVHWYAAPIYIQKLMLFLLQRNNRVFGLNIGGLFIASLQCFASLANASISYFTLMYSVQ